MTGLVPPIACPEVPTEARSVLFAFWGRRGAMARLTLQVARAALADPTLTAAVAVSRQSENFQDYRTLGEALIPIDTFASNGGAVLQAWRIPSLRRRLAHELRRRRAGALIELMPHIWSPFLASAIRDAGGRYVTVVHDAVAHPGDLTALVKPVLDHAIRRADHVIALSDTVARHLTASGRLPADRVSRLFLPDLSYGVAVQRRRDPGRPLRLLFMGRIMAYKGLPMFVDVVQRLRREGVPVEAGVFGEGALGPEEGRLRALGAEVVNRWLTEDEVASALSRFDIMVTTHIEASQSAVVSTAFGAGLPVVTTPVGGLSEQIEDGVNGLVAAAATADAVADAVARIAASPDLYASLAAAVVAGCAERSAARFARECASVALGR